MGIPVSRVYVDVCNALLEPGGLTGETIPISIFFDILNDSIRDLFECSACYRKIFNIVSQEGVRVYRHDYFINQPMTVTMDENTIFQGSGNYWDASDYRWQQLGPGIPQEWRTDELEEDQIEVRPAPAWDGYQVSIPSGFYGTFSQTSNPITFDISVDPAVTGFYGTTSSAEYGSVYVEFAAPMFGVPASIVESTLNITEFPSYTQFSDVQSLNDYIPDFPLSFTPYVVFATLSRIRAMDGELKDTNLSNYYKKRVDELVQLLRSISLDVLLEVPK